MVYIYIHKFNINKQYIKSLIDALYEIKDYQLIITMPNADTMGNYIRLELEKFIIKSNYNPL